MEMKQKNGQTKEETNKDRNEKRTSGASGFYKVGV